MPAAPVATTAVEPAAVEPVVADDGSRIERATVQGDGIRVDVAWWTMTGTTHVASELVVTTPRGTLKLAIAPDDEGGEPIPLIEQIDKLGDDRWLLLGWTSYGGGMQTEHALLVDGSATPRIVDTLAWTTDRAHAGIVVDPAEPGSPIKLRVGIPLPKSSELHDQSDWQLAHDTKTLTLAEVVKLPASGVSPMTVRAYTPPFQTSISERDWTGRYVWFDAGARFALVATR
jgi:hypothetical protein